MGDSFELTFDYPIPDADWDKIMDIEFEKTKSISFRTKSGKTVEFAKVSEEFEWCHDCKEYDAERHCCPRWTKVIRETVKELKQERPKGEWEALTASEVCGWNPEFAGRDPIFLHRCSICKHDVYVNEFGEEILSDFCPFCGADMRGEEDNGTD